MMLRKYSQENKVISIGIILILLLGCYKEEDYNYSSLEIFENLTVKFDKDSIPADGSSSVKIMYAFPIEADVSLTTLQLVASEGKFFESNNDTLMVNFVTLDSSKEKRIKELTLVSSTKVGESVISTTVLNNVKKDTIRFHRAYPISISLESQTFFIKNDMLDTFFFEASLKSENGIASTGQNVFFESPLQHGIQNKAFNSIGPLGQTKFQYVFTDTSFVGNLLFRVIAINQGGDTITASKTIQVID